ncbi:MAG TPA: hypothetical protein DEO32_00085 [Ruminococcaceae bacterium]|nr:hypothetical protein [Oscillospiraceae bacterium]
MTKTLFSSKRLMLTLMLCSCSVILLQNNNVSSENSFTVNILCMLLGLSVCALMIIPSVILKKRYNTDVLTAVQSSPKWLKIVMSSVYALYFVYTAEHFLLPYTELFCVKYYPGVSPCVIGLCLLAACVYAAYKGTNIITRFGIFLFAFALLTNGLMFFGSLSSLDFANNSLAPIYNFDSAAKTFIYFCTPSFIAAIYACTSAETDNFTLKQPFLALAFTGVKYALVMFFTAFAVGAYAQRQQYQSFILSRVAHFSAFGGIESFFTALATMSVFMIISLFLSCVGRTTGKRSLKDIIVFAVIIFAGIFISEWNNSVKEIFTDDLILIIFTVIVAVLIPLAYILKGGSKVETNRRNLTAADSVADGM